MRTLIELYDERPFENVLGTEVFHPQETVFICSTEIAKNAALKDALESYFAYRHVSVKLSFIGTSMVKAETIINSLQKVIAEKEDCAVDISGGTDAALFAAGQVCLSLGVPVFTYSRRSNCFYNIANADFAHRLPCTLKLKVEDCIRMAGGLVETGRVDNAILKDYDRLYEAFFNLFLKHRKNWNSIIKYIQQVSRASEDGRISKHAEGAYTVKGDRASRIRAPQEALIELEQLGMIRNLTIRENVSVSFDFQDLQTRTWLRDMGSVLELYVYKLCRETGQFDDTRTSVVVRWSDDPQAVTNEIDVMATHGVIPIFISCKICDVKTEALNELAILRDRFGGSIARAAIVTAERGRMPMRLRAAELGIEVIDLDDLRHDGGKHRIRALARPFIDGKQE